MNSLSSTLDIRQTPIQKISDASWLKQDVQVFVKREDLCHPIISGNKWHKIYLNLLDAKKRGSQQIISFGGAWSNHIHALAYTCQQEGLKFIAIIRGEELAAKPLNKTLNDARRWGAELVFISRDQYRLKHNSDYVLNLMKSDQSTFVIPEGGANNLGVEGSAHFARACIDDFYSDQQVYPTHVALACGSGTMTAGFVRALSQFNADSNLESNAESNSKSDAEDKVKRFEQINLKVYAVVRDKSLLETITYLASLSESALIKKQAHDFLRSYLSLSYCEGKGFGLSDQAILDFMPHFKTQFGFSLDPVYTAKLFLQLIKDIGEQKFPSGSRILVIHSGGMQGARA